MVFGILTYSPQKLINRIKTDIKRDKIVKHLYINHNLIDKKEIEVYVEKFLLNNITFKIFEDHKVSTELKDNYENEGIYYHKKNSNPILLGILKSKSQIYFIYKILYINYK